MDQHFSRALRLIAAFVGIVLGWPGAYAAEPATRPAGEAGSTLVPVPPEMREDVPPLRTREEVSPLLGKPTEQFRRRPLHVVLVAGPKDHGPGEHDYPAWQKAWEKLFSKAPGTKVTTAWGKPGAEDLKSADVLVIFKHKSWPQELNADVDTFLARGGGIVLLHFAVDCNDNPRAGRQQLGLYWGPGAKFRHGWLDLQFRDDGKHDCLRGLAGKKIRFRDETYWRLTGEPSAIDVLATGREDDGDGHQVRIPLIWNRQVGGGRVHVNILGHYNWTFNDPVFRVLVLRGIAWAAGEPVDRFNGLVLLDVDLKE